MDSGILAESTLAVVLAGGKGTRLGALTRFDCKPALPFGAAYRNIDFSLSNCVNSGIRRIGIATQYRPDSLVGHIDDVWSGAVNGPGEFIEAWPAEHRAPPGGYRGTADAVFRNLNAIRRLRPRQVLVLAGDHIYKMNYRRILEDHCARGADVTIACVEIGPHEARQFGILSVNEHGRIDRFVEKPQRIAAPRGGKPLLASMGIYVFETSFLDAVLCRDAFCGASRHDFGNDILPRLLRESQMYASPFRAGDAGPAYWRDVGTPRAYWQAHLELLTDDPMLQLADPHWPLPAARGTPQLSSRAPRTLIGSGCAIHGRVTRSVLFSDVHVASGAVVEDSVVLPGARVGRDCRITGVIVGEGCRLPDRTHVDAYSGRDRNAATDAPVVVTQEDFTPELACSNA